MESMKPPENVLNADEIFTVMAVFKFLNTCLNISLCCSGACQMHLW